MTDSNIGRKLLATIGALITICSFMLNYIVNQLELTSSLLMQIRNELFEVNKRHKTGYFDDL